MSLANEGFVIGIKPTSILRPHEEVIPSHVKRKASEMTRDGVQKDPIIIDQDTLTVLDGMHRLAAFSALGVENSVCCAVDYSSRGVTLERWARVYGVTKGTQLRDVPRLAGLTRRATLAQAFEALDGRDTGLALLTPDAAYVPEGKLDIDQTIDRIASFDRLSESEGWGREFVSEEDVDVPLQAGTKVVLLVRKLRKEDVVNAARSGKLFPCKTSMHRIDPRPVAVNFPVSELNGATSASLKKKLEGSKERLLPAGSLYEGRRYKERLLLLNER